MRIFIALLFVFVALGMLLNGPDYLREGGRGVVISVLVFFGFVAISIGGKR